MNVLFVASECAPFVKVGGLGDVIGSLPQALIEEGIDARVVIPFYEVIDREKFELEPLMDFDVDYGGERYPVKVFLTSHPENQDFNIYLLQNEKFLSKGGDIAFEGSQEEVKTYTFFSQAVLNLVSKLVHWSLRNKIGEIWAPEVIHCNDWHTGIIPQLLKTSYGFDSYLQKIKTVFTIHNLSYQGISDSKATDDLNESLKNAPLLKWDLQDQNVDLLLQGIIGSDIVNTVSPTYAKEILTKEFGEGLDEVLRSLEGKVRGILNGIDYKTWNPETDKDLRANYELVVKSGSFNVDEVIKARIENKKALQEKLELKADRAVMLLGFIGRLDGAQKGLDLLEGLINKVPDLSFPLQLIILGTGEKEWEEKLEKAGEKTENTSVNIKFDSSLARLMFSGCDSILMPSRFEPCGLPQMIGMRYGALPLVHGVGGLKDSVDNGRNGFVFDDYSLESFLQTISKANETFNNKEKWQEMVLVAMQKDFSWKRSAREYERLYREIIP